MKFDFNLNIIKNPSWGICICLIFLMLIGMPPFILFFIKTLLLFNLVNYTLTFYGILLLIFSALNAFYYLSIIRIFFVQTAKNPIYLTRLLGIQFLTFKEKVFNKPDNVYHNDILFE